MIEVPITDTFDQPQGQFKNYTAYDPDAAAQLALQKHIDLRNAEVEYWQRAYAATVQWDNPALYWRLGKNNPEPPTSTEYRDAVLGDKPTTYWRLGEAVPGPYPDTILADNPALFWRFDETSGTTAEDATANNRDGTLAAGAIPNQSSGIAGSKCYFFDNSGQARVTSTYTPFVNGTIRTFEGWASRAGSADADCLISGDGTDRPELRLGSANQNVVWQATGVASTVTWTAAWPGNSQWVHWVLIFDEPRDLISLYINGALVSTQAATDSYGAVPGNFKVGSTGPGSNSPWNGNMDEIAVYEFALSAEQIRKHYEAGYQKVIFARDSNAFDPSYLPSLESWLKPEALGANGSKVTQWTDSSGKGNHAVAVTEAGKPTVATAALDGKSAAVFDGTNDYLSLPTILGNDPTRTIFMVARHDGGATQGYFWDLGNVGEASLGAHTQFIYVRDETVSTVTLGGTPSNWNAIAVRHNSTSSLDFYLNGGSTTNFNPRDEYQSSNQQMIIGQRQGVQFLNGRIAEVIIFNSALTETERTKVLRYLSEKYPSLASGVPFGSDTKINGAVSTGTSGVTFGQAGALIGDNDKSASWDGASTSKISAPYALLPVGSNRTIECWYYRTNTTSLQYLFNDGQTALRFEGTGAGNIYAVAGGVFTTQLAATNPVNKWTHLAVVFNDLDDYVELYLNGVSQGRVTHTTAFAAGSTLYIGAADSFGNQSFQGRIDEFAIYERALTPAEILEHAVAGGYENVAIDSSPRLYPNDLPSMSLWLKPETLGASGSSITTWADSSGNANDATEGTNPPTVVANALDGYKAANFDGTNDRLTVSGILNNKAARTIFAVAASDTNGTNRRLICIGGANTSCIRPNTNWEWATNQAGAGQTLGDTATTAYKVVTVRLNNTSSADGYVNGRPSTGFDPSDGYQSGTAASTIGSTSAPADFFDGRIVEMIVFDSALNETERTKVLSYLSTKYPSLGPMGKERFTGAYGTGISAGYEGAIEGDPDTAIAADGTAQGVVTSAYSPFVGSSQRTFEGWFYRTSSTTDDVLFGGSNTDFTWVEFVANTNNIRFNPNTPGGDTPRIWTNVWPGKNEWVHWVITHNDATATSELFINGVSKGTLTHGVNYHSAPGTFQLFTTGSGFQPGIGRMDEVAVYEYLLSAARIKAHYDTGKQLFAVSEPFDPSDIAGLQLWLKPESLGANGSAIATWTDSSGLGNDATQGTAGNRPVVAEQVLDGYSVARCDGSNDYLSVAGITNNDATRTMFVVAKHSTGGQQTVLGFTGQTAKLVRASGSNQWAYANNQAAGEVLLGGNWDSWNSVAIRYTSTSSAHAYRCGALPVSFDPSDVYQSGVGAAVLLVGAADAIPSQPFGGDIAEVIVFNSTLSDADVQRVLGYLTAKYPTLGGYGTQPAEPPEVRLAALEDRRAVRLTLTQGETSFESVVKDLAGNVRSLDLGTDFDGDDAVLVNLYPLVSSDFDLTQSFIDFTDGSGETISIPWNGRLSTQSYSGLILESNPLLYWRLGETSGTSAADSSSNGNAGTYGSGTALDQVGAVNNDSNRAVAFDGSGNAEITSSFAPYVNGVTRTYEGWAWRANSSTSDTLIGGSSGTNGTALILMSGGNDVRYGIRADLANNTWSGAWPGNEQWAHWVLIVNETANTVELYINGVSKGVLSDTNAYGTPGNFEVGQYGSGGDPFTGKMDEIAVYNGALDAITIASHYTAGARAAGLSIPHSDLVGIDLTDVVKIGLRPYYTKASGQLFFLAARLLADDWQYSQIDLDTLSERLISPLPPSGLLSEDYGFEMPRVFRSAEPASADDPRPIDASIGVVFNSGTAEGTNRFTLYFRELVEDYLTQLDLDGMSQSELQAMARQPDTGDGKWDPRELEDFEGMLMEDLEGDLMQDLERIEDFDLSSWFSISFQWGLDRVIISGDAEDNGIAFEDIPLLSLNQRYLFLAEVEEHGFRGRIYPVTAAGVVQYNSILYDTLHVIDDFLVKRRKGRIGWEATLDDGSAYIEEIRTRDLNFAEYRSQPFESITPVEGAQLFAEFPPEEQLFSDLDGIGEGVVSFDSSKANASESGGGDTTSYKVVIPADADESGARTNVVNFENFNDYEIEFDIWYPASALVDGRILKLYIVDDYGNKYALSFGNVSGDTWVSRAITPVEGNAALTGRYFLSWEQEGPPNGESTTFWLDNIRVHRRSMRWEARSALSDPWEDNPSTWVNFRDKVNDPNDGVLFFEKGKYLQVRGKALRQNVTLGQLQVVPKYAELGRTVFTTRQSSVDLSGGVVPAMPQSTYTTNLGSQKKLDRVVMTWLSPPAFVQFLGSNDNVTFSPILTQAVPANAGIIEYPFPGQPTYQYLRITSPAGTPFSWLGNRIVPALQSPTAAFTTSAAGFTITFNGSTSTDPDGRIISYVWSFGDGSIGYGLTAKHTYVGSGSYQVTLTVIDDTGLAHSLTQTVGV